APPAAPRVAPRPAPTAVPPPDLAEDGDAPDETPPHVDFELPPTRLLHPLPPETAFDNSAEIAERSRVIEDTLAEFQLPGAVTHVVSGPTITRYEVKPEAGVKVDRIQGVHRNLQMNLRAKSLRIVAPIPGKDVVGIEVPNIKSRPVPLRGIAESPEWKEAAAKMALPMLLSRDIDGQPVIADLAKMPHMIVAGTTGSGKSVTLNGILAGWLLTRTPEQLRLVLVDPKRVEFTPYADIPHLVVPVITEAPKVAVCLQWAVKEMDKRLKLFQKVGVRNISAYNSRPMERQGMLFGEDESAPADEPATLPYIAIVIDEMSDLMMLAGADVEPRVVRLAQLARAVGIHLIIATQRPDVKVITGKIKANFPARIALKVSSAVDSITIVDQGGAQSLIGRGDMLFLNPTSSAGLQRSQSCWIDDDEIAALTQWYRDQSPPMYVPDIKAKLDKIKVKDAGDEFKTFEADDGGDGGGGGEDAAADGEEALLQKCLDTIVAADRASTSMLQRKLRLGYNKAARIMDELETRGCIGPANGAAPREILRTTVRDPAGDSGGDPGADDADGADDAGGDE
ncbi:MAG: DNA translocase FtsK, partial [Kiritimatiellae bacterium]|nr:DNA translocase FtsK [Kiritimatiellia bacterium]